MSGWFAIPRDWLATFGDIVRFCGRVMGEVFGMKPLATQSANAVAPNVSSGPWKSTLPW